MRRTLALIGLFLTGCMSPGRSPYDRLDDQAPTIDSIDPAMGGDAGVPTIRGGQIITITFSEQMNVETLRPGIVIRNKDRKELPLSILLESDPTPVSYGTTEDGGYRSPQMAVQVTSAEGGFERGSYQLILRTLLIDRAGNSISSEFLGAFVVGF